MIWFLYNLLLPVGVLLALPKFLLRMARRGGYRRHFEQRIACYGHGTLSALKAHRRIWIHAVSVGEIYVALRFIEEYRNTHPAARFVLSTTTSTGHAIGEEKIDKRDVLIYFPVDLFFVMRRAFKLINPLKIILVECEFWANLLWQAQKRGIPVALINGRLSDSSFRGYGAFRSFTSGMLKLIDPICVQGRQDAGRMVALGARPETVKTLGTAKYDMPLPEADAEVAARAVLAQIGAGENATVFLGGSTWPGEEAALCRIYKKLKPQHPDLLLVMVPRHVERAEEVIRCFEEQNFSFVRRNELNGPDVPRPDVLFIDTTGELKNFYTCADVVFVGKSLCEHGGQNPIEPAMFGKPIITGPNMENFPLVMEDFRREEAVREVADEAELEQAVSELLADSSARHALGTAAARVVEEHRGVIAEMVEQVG